MYRVKYLPKMIIIVIVAVSLLLSVSCWDSREIDDLALILGIAVDYIPEEEKVMYSTLVVRPGQVGGVQEGSGQFFMGPVWISESSGKTLFEASRNLSSRSPRFIFESHIQAIVVGEEIARRGIAEVVDYVTREREQRLLPPFLIAKGRAVEVFRAEPELENNIAQEIRGILNSQLDLSTTPVINVKNFILPLNQPGIDAVAPVIQVSEVPTFPDEELPVGYEPESKKTISIEGTAVFSRNQLAGFLDVPETKGMLWVRGDVTQTTMIPRLPDEGEVTVYIIRSGSSMEPEFIDNKLKISIQIETEGDIFISTIRQDISDPEVIEELEKTLANHIKQEILAAAAKSKEYQSDFLGFGAAFRRKDPEKWKEFEKSWREMLQEVEVEVRVLAEIRRTGLISTPILVE